MAPKTGKAVVTSGKQRGSSINTGEVKFKNSYYDKQSGGYGRVTTKQSVSSGPYTNRGKDGYKDEYKASETVRVGDKGGYTEYSKQEKFTRVQYGGGSNNFGGGNQICGGGGSEDCGGYSSDGYASDGGACYDDDDCASDGGGCGDDVDGDYSSEGGGCDDDDDDFDDDDDGGDDDFHDDDGCYDSDY